METIKVNMNPNPLDVQTIHASQNDGEARQWEYELHNNGELIDTSEVTEQLFFKAYKGGTEQILPENTSTPTTSPFKGDIKYPQGLLSDQEFTYRQSPTEEDGYAKIETIYGNTLVWNQLWDYENISFQQGLTVTKPGDGVYLINGTRTTSASGDAQNILKSGHKYLIKSNTDNGTIVVTNSITWGTTQATYILNATADGMVTYFINSGTYTNVKFIPQVIDLTLMFGAGNEPSTLEEFASLFPLSYYSYNQGSLLSFNGNGIKTVGKNLLNPSFTTINAYINGSVVITASSNDKSVIIPLLPNLDYVFTWNRGEIISSVTDDTQVGLYNEYPSIGMQGTYGGNTNVSGGNIRFNSRSNRYAVIKIANKTRTDFDSTIIGSQLEFGTTPSSYEPYTSSTLSLPISTYFPTGMKSAGSVYDELTPTKAITRIGVVDLGSLTWTYANNCFAGTLPSNSYRFASDVGATSIYQFVGTVPNGTSDMGDKADKTFALFYNSANTTPRLIYVKDLSYTDATVFKNAMSGVYLNYELATPIETSFTTASLVTENAEIPLSNEDGVLLGKCTEQLSENPGFIDAKIKLSDADGECYSNKLQLHVERSPQ